MQFIKTSNKLRQAINTATLKNKKVGFVPTMGDLHEGHISLIRKCRKENDIVVVSIFVNPLQFGPKEDYKKYPRNKNEDVLLTKNENIDIIFYPSKEEMYSRSFLTTVKVSGLNETLCGKYRPRHFDGVATIMVKLLNLVSPHTLYLGQKDAQQANIISQLITDFNMAVNVKVCPIVREKDGLALSSRNKYLAVRQRQEAVILFKSLKKARQMIKSGERNSATIRRIIRNLIKQKSKSQIEYIECVDHSTLKPIRKIKGKVLIALSVWFGKARLIDNIVVRVK